VASQILILAMFLVEAWSRVVNSLTGKRRAPAWALWVASAIIVCNFVGFDLLCLAIPEYHALFLLLQAAGCILLVSAFSIRAYVAVVAIYNGLAKAVPANDGSPAQQNSLAVAQTLRRKFCLYLGLCALALAMEAYNVSDVVASQGAVTTPSTWIVHPPPVDVADVGFQVVYLMTMCFAWWNFALSAPKTTMLRFELWAHSPWHKNASTVEPGPE